MAFVAGKKRVPKPATGKTALRIWPNSMPSTYLFQNAICGYKILLGAATQQFHNEQSCSVQNLM